MTLTHALTQASTQNQLAHFLAASNVVDYHHPDVAHLARTLRAATPDETARRCFEWVRDEVAHSIDFQRDEVTCTASAALAARTGLCIAKSHLAVALLRANGIASGFCYQRLRLGGPASPFCLHGLIAVWRVATRPPDGSWQCTVLCARRAPRTRCR